MALNIVNKYGEKDSVSALLALREGTRKLHYQLDHSSLMTSLLNQNCSIAEYDLVMHALYCCYIGVDQVLNESHHLCPAKLPKYVQRIPYIEKNIGLLDKCIIECDNTFDLNISSQAEYLGMRYVIEGASLGSKVIKHKLSKNSLSQSHPELLSFWQNDKPWNDVWKGFILKLDDLKTDLEISQAVELAKRTFIHFIKHLKIK